MSDDKKEFPRDFTGDAPSREPGGQKRADPLEDVREGLGLLFRAAKSTIEKLPTKDIEKGVSDGVQEVGKAIGRVVEAIGKELTPKKGAGEAPPAASPPSGSSVAGAPPSQADQVRVADDKAPPR